MCVYLLCYIGGGHHAAWCASTRLTAVDGVYKVKAHLDCGGGGVSIVVEYAVLVRRACVLVVVHRDIAPVLSNKLELKTKQNRESITHNHLC